MHPSPRSFVMAGALVVGLGLSGLATTARAQYPSAVWRSYPAYTYSTPYSSSPYSAPGGWYGYPTTPGRWYGYNSAYQGAYTLNPWMSVHSSNNHSAYSWGQYHSTHYGYAPARRELKLDKPWLRR